MSDVKRWKETESWGFTEGDCMAVMRECNDGEYVLYSDYARLKAEVERLESMADENAHLHKGIYSLSLNVGQLKDEVERLRFAGDILAFTLAHGDRQEYGDPSEPIEEYMNRIEIKGWIAAKEGKQP